MSDRSDNSLFGWLVRYRLERNLPEVLPYIQDGQVLDFKGKPLPVGRENPYTAGCLILADGQTLADRLRGDDRIILDTEEPEFLPAANYTTFERFLDQQITEDGAFVYDGRNRQMARVTEFNNKGDSLLAERIRDNAGKYLPPDFLTYGATSPQKNVSGKLGTKTKLALVLPIFLSTNDWQVHAYQIKRTAYGQPGMGKVTHFGRNGLEEEFFVKYEPDSVGPFLDEEARLVGVYRKYAWDSAADRVKLVWEEPKHPDHYLIPSQMKKVA